MGRVDRVPDHGISKVDRLNVSDDIHSIHQDMHPVTDGKRLEDRQNETVNDITEALLEHKAQDHHDQ